MVEVKRFWIAPMSAREEFTAFRASSTIDSAFWAPATEEMSTPLTVSRASASAVAPMPAMATVRPVASVVAVVNSKSLPDFSEVSSSLPSLSSEAYTPVWSILSLMALTTFLLTSAALSPTATSTAAMATPLISMSLTVPAAVAVPVRAAAVEVCLAAYRPLPSSEVLELTMLLMPMVWPESAPIWNSAPENEPSSSLVPLKLVWRETRSISEVSCFTSAFSASRSLSELVALADCTDSSRIRCRLLPISTIAPSAVWASEMPSLALRTATSRPRIWVLKRSEIARPAASSLALLMRRPEDRRWIVVARLEPLVDRLR